jgi:hypothetical protein
MRILHVLIVHCDADRPKALEYDLLDCLVILCSSHFQLPDNILRRAYGKTVQFDLPLGCYGTVRRHVQDRRDALHEVLLPGERTFGHMPGILALRIVPRFMRGKRMISSNHLSAPTISAIIPAIAAST